jgi:hypothetical protein
MFRKQNPNGEIRLLADLVPLNEITIKDHGQIDNQALILKTLGSKEYCSTIDRADWYFQIRVEPECVTYNTIKTPFVSFAYQVMLQVETNVLATAM